MARATIRKKNLDPAELLQLGTITPLYLRTLRLESVRCFKGPQTIDFTANGKPARWTVIIGANGTGKTTILEAIAAVFPVTSAHYRSDVPQSEELYWSITSKVFSEFARTYLKESQCNDRPLRITADFQKREMSLKSKAKLETTVELLQDGKLDEFFHDKGRNLSVAMMWGGSEGPAIGQKFSGSKPASHEYYSLVAGYGAHRLAGTLDEPQLSGNSSDSVASLFSPYVRLANAEEWLLQADYSFRLQKTSDEIQSPFGSIKLALQKIIPGIIDVKIGVNESTKKPEVAFETSLGLFPLRNLSFGYQVTISWIIDFARRLMDHYPDVENFLDQPALALIDEIDLHLHPSWQRLLMDNLGKIFPGTQFIVTAHSPLIIQSASDANVILLKVENDHVVIDSDISSVQSWRVDQILTSDLFGLPSARSPRIESLLEERMKIQTKPKQSANDGTRLEELNRLIGTLPTADSKEDRDAIEIIRDAAKLLSKTKKLQ